VQFHLLRATKSAASTAAFAVALAIPALMPTSYAQAAPGGQAPAQGTATQGAAQGGTPAPTQTKKNWKDRAEYDLYNSIAHEQDPKKRLALLDTWTQKYPTTDFEDLRNQTYVATLGPLSQQDPTLRPKLVEYAKKELALDPKNFTALYWLALTTPAAGGNSPTPEQLADAQTAGEGLLAQADATFDPSKKPAATSQADWEKAKNDVIAVADAALGWAAQQKKDYATAQKEFEAYLKANPNNAAVSYQLGQVLLQEQKPDLYPEALWEFARAGAYDGPGAIPAAKRPDVLAYFKKVYTQYHGSPDGADEIIAQAKTSPLPPDGFKIVSAADTANKQAADLQSKLQADPSLALWYSLQQSLVGDQGDSFFANNVKDAEIPGGANGVKTFTGTVISVDPPEHPTKVVLGVLDPTKPDATLIFSEPVPASAVKVGDKIQFSGVGDSFTKDPYMLTFKDPTVPGLKAPTKRAPHKALRR
jgi:hypothetical protein